jgi:hypothetical protein
MHDRLRAITRRATATAARLYAIPGTSPETTELVDCMAAVCEMIEGLAQQIAAAQNAADDTARRQSAIDNGMDPDC